MKLTAALLLSLISLALIFTGCDSNNNNNNNNNTTVITLNDLAGNWRSVAYGEETTNGPACSATTDSSYLTIQSSGAWTKSDRMNNVAYSASGNGTLTSPWLKVWVTSSNYPTGGGPAVGDTVTFYITLDQHVMVMRDTIRGTTHLEWNAYIRTGQSGYFVGGVVRNSAVTSYAVSGANVTAALPNASPVTTTSNNWGFFYYQALNTGNWTFTGTYNSTNLSTVTRNVTASAVHMFELIYTAPVSNFGTVTGTIRDVANNNGLANVAVACNGINGTTNTSGVYTLNNVPAGSAILTATLANYISASASVYTNPGQTSTQDLYLAATSAANGTVTGWVRSATTNTALVGAVVRIEGGDSATTDASGNYTISVRAGTRAITARYTNYYNQVSTILRVQSGVSTTQNFQLSPTFSTGSGRLRFVLSWGQNPGDLDSHVKTPTIGTNTYHVYYGSRGDSANAPFVRLDQDVVSGYGPETVTFYQFSNGTYRYYIYKYSGTGDLSQSGATVNIYGASGLIRQITVPSATNTGRFWYVCDIDGATQNITYINTVQATEPTAPNEKVGTVYPRKDYEK